MADVGARAKDKLAKARDKVEERTPLAELPPKPRRRFERALGLGLLGGAAAWAGGFGILRATGLATTAWNAFWAQAGTSLLTSLFIPMPGVTTALFVAVQGNALAQGAVVAAAALGGTIGAAILLVLGQAGRRFLERKAKTSKRSRTVLAWSRKLVGKWAYAGVAVLLVPPFVPKAPVLAAAGAVELRRVPYLACVLAGLLARNAIYMLTLDVAV